MFFENLFPVRPLLYLTIDTYHCSKCLTSMDPPNPSNRPSTIITPILWMGKLRTRWSKKSRDSQNYLGISTPGKPVKMYNHRLWDQMKLLKKKLRRRTKVEL